MDLYYSNSQPNLVSDNVYKYFTPTQTGGSPTQTFHIGNFFYDLWNNYIWPNFWTIFFISIIVLFLWYRYNMKKKDYYTTKELEGNFYRPTFNPFYKTDKQINYSLYPPHPIYTKIIDKDAKDEKDSYRVEEVRDIYNPTDNYPERKVQYFPQTFPNYGANQPPGPQYSGTGSLYETDYPNSPYEFSIPNPLGFASNFNETTGQFINGSTDLNKKNIADYCESVKQTNEDLIKSLKFGPEYLNPNSADTAIQPPYSQ